MWGDVGRRLWLKIRSTSERTAPKMASCQPGAARSTSTPFAACSARHASTWRQVRRVRSDGVEIRRGCAEVAPRLRLERVLVVHSDAAVHHAHRAGRRALPMDQLKDGRSSTDDDRAGRRALGRRGRCGVWWKKR